MFPILGRSTKLCDGISRRELLRVGGLTTLGLSLPSLLRATEGPPTGVIDDPTFGKARSIIYVWLQGGPPQHETFDPKPHAPAEIRGPFKPIGTNVAGVHFCELLPRTARIADKLAIVRSISTDNNIHSASGYHVLTGYKYQGPNARQITPADWPWFGSLVKMLKPSEKLPPLSTVWIPRIMRLNENVMPAGQTAGFLGRQWDPDRFEGDPSAPNYRIEGFQQTDVPPLRLQRRMSLLEQVERHFATLERGRAVGVYDKFQSQAFDLLASGRVREAFDVNKEPAKIRDRYGRTKWGQCLLLARRLVEVGVRLVHVNWTREPGDSAVDNPMWDTHAQNADRLEDVLCPMFDVGFTALIEDLDRRGLLDETLVVAIGEFGRTPKINAIAGRDHWGPVFSFAMAGAGIAGGQVYGESDREGAYPAKDRVTPGDLTATIFHLLGIDPRGTFLDAQRRPHHLTEGRPITPLFGRDTPAPRLVPPGGEIARVPPYDDSLLLNTTFEAGVPLRPVDRGSRPKGWRASPIVSDGSDDFGVKLVVVTQAASLRQPREGDRGADAATREGEAPAEPPPNVEDSRRESRRDSRSESPTLKPARPEPRPPAAAPEPAFDVRPRTAATHVAIGFGLSGGKNALTIPPGAHAILAQEMRNPRLGRFTFAIRACCEASSPEFYRDVFLKHFTCRLTIYRYADAEKNPLRRQEFISATFQPPLAADSANEKRFEVTKLLDSPAPGQNFPIGNGYGVAVTVERITPGPLTLPADDEPRFAFLRIDDVVLEFTSRTINEDVKV